MFSRNDILDGCMIMMFSFIAVWLTAVVFHVPLTNADHDFLFWGIMGSAAVGLILDRRGVFGR